jgi:hypothetical protein
MGKKMSEDFIDRQTLKQKLDAARAGEPPQRMRSRSKPPLALNIVLLVVLGAAVAAAFAFPWVIQQPRDRLFPFIGGYLVLILAANFALAVFADRGMDEWQRNAVRFSSQWGYGAGLVLAFLLIFPLGAWTESWAPGAYVRTGFMLGFAAVMIAQVACVALLHLGWTLWKSRSAPHEKQD